MERYEPKGIWYLMKRNLEENHVIMGRNETFGRFGYNILKSKSVLGSRYWVEIIVWSWFIHRFTHFYHVIMETSMIYMNFGPDDKIEFISLRKFVQKIKICKHVPNGVRWVDNSATRFGIGI